MQQKLHLLEEKKVKLAAGGIIYLGLKARKIFLLNIRWDKRQSYDS
jgi:hypothetical protein